MSSTRNIILIMNL